MTMSTMTMECNVFLLLAIFAALTVAGIADQPSTVAEHVEEDHYYDYGSGPVANAGPNAMIRLPENAVTLYGNGSTAEHNIVSYEWTLSPETEHLSVDMAGTRTESLHLSNLDVGHYEFILKVTDSQGQSSTDSVHVLVAAAVDRGPSAVVSSDVHLVLPDNAVTLYGNASSDDVGIESYEWSLHKVPGQNDVSMTGKNTPFLHLTDLGVGVYSFTLRVWDTSRQVSTAEVKVFVEAEPRTSCPRPDDTLNGAWATFEAGEFTHAGYPFKARIVYSCSPQYDLVGQQSIECLTSGAWSDDAPKCVPKVSECAEPTVEHGSIESGLNNGTGGYHVGDIVEISCATGYRFPHKSSMLQLECVSAAGKGIWRDFLGDEHPSACERIGGCVLPLVPHGRVMDKTGGYMPGEVAPMLCEAGYVMKPTETPHLVCQSDGSWKTSGGYPALPSCEEQYCQPPVRIDNGVFQVISTYGPTHYTHSDGRTVPEGTAIYYYCEDGFKMSADDNPVLVCTKGSWDTPFPACVRDWDESMCKYPSEIPFGSLVAYDRKGNKIDRSEVPEGSMVRYTCNFGYKLEGDQLRACKRGLWNGRQPSCMPITGCGQPPDVPHGEYNFLSQKGGEFGEKLPGGTKVYYFCSDGFKLKGQEIATIVCRDGQWEGGLPQCEQKTHCDPPVDISDGNWVIKGLYADYRIGTHIMYECDEDYKAIGQTEIVCDEKGHWSEHTPKCLPKEMYCSEPGPVQNGFYLCRPHACDLFSVGTEVHYVCNRNYEQQPGDVMKQTCDAGGRWSALKPVCLPVAAAVPENTNGNHLDINTSTLTVVIATSCSVLGLLLLVMVIFALQRRRKSPARILSSASSAPPPYSPQQENAANEEQDRVALIAFADGVQVVLPSYEEAVRGRPNGPRLARFNSDSSHSSGRSARCDYRPLPSIPQGWRGGVSYPAPPDHHRNSIITTTSTTTRDNLSLAFGSMDTMNASDGTSTTVTIGTYDSAGSNPSIATSQRAAVGSLGSGESRASLATEDAPLLEQDSVSAAEPHCSHSLRESSSPQPEHTGTNSVKPEESLNTDNHTL